MRFYEFSTLMEGINILDQEPVKTFQAEVAELATAADAKAWLTSKSLTKQLVAREDCAAQLQDVNVEELPDWAQAAFEAGDLYEFKPSQEIRDQLEHIIDWLNWCENGYGEIDKDDPFFNEKRQFTLAAQKDLKAVGQSKLKIDQAHEKAEEWVRFMNQLTQREQAAKVDVDAEDADDGIVANSPDYDIVTRFEGGFVAVRLKSANALAREGAAMDHCVGSSSYWSRVRAGSTQIYSVRSNRGEPVVTIEVTDGVVRQVKGRSNRPPVPRYLDMAVETLNKVKCKGDCGDLDGAGVYYSESSGRFATFEESANLVIDKPPVQVYRLDDKIQLTSTKLGKIFFFSGKATQHYAEKVRVNNFLSAKEFWQYRMAVASTINTFMQAAVTKNPNVVEELCDRCSLVFDPKDNKVKEVNEDLMTEVFSHGDASIYRRGTGYYIKKDQSFHKLVWGKVDLVPFQDIVAAWLNTSEGNESIVLDRYGGGFYGQSGNATPYQILRSSGLVYDGSELYTPDELRVLYSDGENKICFIDHLANVGDDIIAAVNGNRITALLSADKVVDSTYKPDSGALPPAPRWIDLFADGVAAGCLDFLNSRKKNSYISVLVTQGANLKYTDDAGIGYTNSHNEIGAVTVQVGRVGANPMLTFVAPTIAGKAAKISAEHSIKGMEIMGWKSDVTGELSDEVRKDLLTAINKVKSPWRTVPKDIRLWLEYNGLEITQDGGKISSKFAKKLVWRSQGVSVYQSGVRQGNLPNSNTILVKFSITKGEQETANILCEPMSNGLRIQKIDAEAGTSGLADLCEFVNDMGKELRIYPPKAPRPEFALSRFNIVIKDGELSPMGDDIDREVVAYSEGSIQLDKNLKAVQTHKSPQYTQWRIRYYHEGQWVDLMGITTQKDHIYKSEFKTHAHRKEALKALHRFIGILMKVEV